MKHIVVGLLLAAASCSVAAETPSSLLRSLDMPSSNPLVQDFLEGREDFGKMFNRVPASIRVRAALRNRSVGERITRPGQPVAGQDAGRLCTGPTCGTGTQGQGAINCPVGLCAGPAEGCQATRHSNFCGFPRYAPLPITKDGQSGLTYVRDSFSEVAVTSFLGEDNKPFRACSATLIAPDWAISAFHCFAEDTLPTGRHAIADVASLFDGVTQVRPGWSRLTLIPLLPIALTLPEVMQMRLVDAIYVPYGSDDQVDYVGTGIPDRDFALLKLAEPFALPAGSLPWLDDGRWPLDADNSITFAGFGRTDVSSVSEDQPSVAALSADWAARRFTAFNFVSDTSDLSQNGRPAIKWKQHAGKGHGGPCSGDSGGPVYAGFNRGYWDDPDILVGVVSSLEPAVAPSPTAAHCIQSHRTGTAILLAPYHKDICAVTGNAPKGCQ